MISGYIDRNEAAQILIESLQAYKENLDFIILALPRGGVPIASQISKFLNVPMYPLIVRKLGVPWHEELAFGAITSGEGIYLNQQLIDELSVSEQDIKNIIQKEKKELARRESLYGRYNIDNLVNQKIVCIVDDGIATGATMFAAVNYIKKNNPKKVIIAVPVAADDTCKQLEKHVDQIICPLKPKEFNSVGDWYQKFPQVSDQEVLQVLKSRPC